MNILIPKELKIYNLNLKLHFTLMWEDSNLFETETLNQVIEDVFETKFELIILDIDMEDNDKIEQFVAKAIRYTKIIIFTNNSELSNREMQLLEIGADAIVSKHASPEDIISTLNLVFG